MFRAADAPPRRGRLIQSGGFGSYSKHYGLAAAGLLEAEVVTADGQIRVANACTNPDLFWALKGGGGGSFGVVSKVTLRVHDLPEFFARDRFPQRLFGRRPHRARQSARATLLGRRMVETALARTGRSQPE
jgi:hypothetical protein